MIDALLHAYLPLFFWTGLGVISLRFFPEALPRFLGRALYWVGVPLEILALARKTDFSAQVGLAPLLTIATLIGGLGVGWVSLQILQQVVSEHSDSDLESTHAEKFTKEPTCSQSSPSPDAVLQAIGFTKPATWHDRARQGSFLLSAMLGNTGFVGLAIVPVFIDPAYLSWAVIYGVTQNVIGTYGLGVWLASRFSRPTGHNSVWMQVRDMVTVPSLWAFLTGTVTQSIGLPDRVEAGLQASVWVVIPTALILMGMRISQLRGWKSLQLAIVPAILKSLVLPLLLGVATSLLGIPAGARLALVLMAAMPTAFAGLILAEEYNLDRELIASSIVLTTVALVFTIPGWLFLLG